MRRQFSLDRVNRAGAVVVRRKLDWINKQHIHRRLASEVGRTSLVAASHAVLQAGIGPDTTTLTGAAGRPRWQDGLYVLRVLDVVKVSARPAKRPSSPRVPHSRPLPAKGRD